MGRVYPSIQNCPFRKVLKRERVRNDLVEETLSCGHKHDAWGTFTNASKRRCYTCKKEREISEKEGIA